MEICRFPNKLKTCRRLSGYSRKKVARIIGHADTSTISRWERGIALPGLLQTFHLAQLYQVLPHELYPELWEKLWQETGLLTQDDESFNTDHSFFI